MNPKATRFCTRDDFNQKYAPAYNREEIKFTDHIRKVGGDFKGIAEIWTRELFDAFGLKWERRQS